jgi:hypothetical protein
MLPPRDDAGVIVDSSREQVLWPAYGLSFSNRLALRWAIFVLSSG